MIVERNFKTVFFKISLIIIITLNNILEIRLLELFSSARFNLTIRSLFKRPIFERGDAKWIDVLPKTTKHYINRVHNSTGLTPIQASLKKNEGFVYQNLLDKRKKTKPK